MLDLEEIKAREKAANLFEIVCGGLGDESWITAGYGSKNMKRDFTALIEEVERLGEESSSYLAILESELNFKVIKSPDK